MKSLLAGSALLLLCAAASAAESVPTWYTQALAHSETAGLNVTYFWSKGPNLRAETVVSGHPVVTIVAGNTYYAYDALLREGVAIERAPEAIAQDGPERRPFGRELEILRQQGAEKVRQDRLLGADCDVWRVTDNHGKRELWVTRTTPSLPVRLEIYSRRTASTRTTDYLNWLSGLPIPDAFFAPAQDVKLARFSFEDYLEVTVNQGPVGPVPVLYADLLHGGRIGAPPR